jgi:branched-chain amino acid transport system substrate-binding protein
VDLYHDSAFGKEPLPVFEALAAKYGFELIKIPVAHPGNTQESQWLQIRQARPDYVILWGWGVMNPTALKAAAKIGFPRNKVLGVWWAGSEEDVIPAGDAAKGYVTAAFSAPGTNFPVMQDIKTKLYAGNKGNLEDASRQGSIYHTRGVTYGIIIVEAIRKAQDKYGKGKVMTPEQVKWGMENLDLTADKLKALGFGEIMRPVKTTCADHMGTDWARIVQWDGGKWNITSDWYQSDKSLIDPMVKELSAKYAADKKITARSCS